MFQVYCNLAILLFTKGINYKYLVNTLLTYGVINAYNIIICFIYSRFILYFKISDNKNVQNMEHIVYFIIWRDLYQSYEYNN